MGIKPLKIAFVDLFSIAHFKEDVLAGHLELSSASHQWNIKGPFGSQNTPLEWNDYSHEMIILLFGNGLFLRIVIPIRITNPLHTGIVMPLKNKRNSYS